VNDVTKDPAFKGYLKILKKRGNLRKICLTLNIYSSFYIIVFISLSIKSLPITSFVLNVDPTEDMSKIDISRHPLSLHTQ